MFIRNIKEASMKKTVQMIALVLFSLSSVSAFAAAAKTVKLNIATVGDTMAYDQAVLTVPAGAKVQLTLKNNGKSEAMQHNWVLTKPGASDKVAMDGTMAGDKKGYIPDSPDIIAHTRLLKPGKSQTITFTAPSVAGDYPYVCTYPGHYVMMKGVLKVQ
jgi:azurin